MKIAINQAVFFTAETEKFLEQCSFYGIEAVEIRIPKLKEWLYHTPLSKASKKLKELNLKVIALNSLDDFSLVPEENLDFLVKETELAGMFCEAVGCNLVIAPAGRWFADRIPQEEVRKLTMERLELLDNVLDKYGVKVGLEPIAFPEFSIHSVFEADEICRKCRPERNGLVVDYYNLFQGGMRPDDFSGLKSDIYLIHINDSDFLPPEKLDVCSTRVFPGDGCLDAADWTRKALDAGYKGYFSLEIFSKELWETDIESGMYKAVEKLKSFEEKLKGEIK